jgi:hypothetical protein
MRNSGTETPQFHVDPTGKLLGLSLGFDFCAEHEGGIERLKMEYGVTNRVGVIGLEARQTTRCSPRLAFIEKTAEFKTFKYNSAKERTAYTRKIRDQLGTKECILVHGWNITNNTTNETEIKDIDRQLSLYEDRPIAAAWDDESFAVKVRGEDNRKYLAQIRDAFHQCNIAFLGQTVSSSWIKRSGLLLAIASEMPQSIHDEYIQHDKDQIRLKDAHLKTGITERLKAAGRGYFALSPHWLPKDHAGSAFPVYYWLNPREQQQNNYGYFTVEQLDEWIAGTGPIPKKEAKV